MAGSAKIVAIKHDYNPNEYSIVNSLSQKGKSLYPGTAKRLIPVKGTNGAYLTGLDPLVPEIVNIQDPAVRKIKQKEILDRRERLEKSTGIISDPNHPDTTGLGPRSDYYSGVYGVRKWQDGRLALVDLPASDVAHEVYLHDGENIFNFSDPRQEIDFLWIQAGWKSLVAPSLSAWKAGQAKANVQFYIENSAEEAEVLYKKARARFDAERLFDSLSLTKRKIACRLCKIEGIPEDAKEEAVYVAFSAWLQQPVKDGEYKSLDPIHIFTKIMGMDAKTQEVTDLVEQAIKFRILNVQHGKLFEGKKPVMDRTMSKEEYVAELCLEANQQLRQALDIHVNDKIKLRA